MKINEIKTLEELNEAVGKNRSLKEAVRLKCIECSAFQYSEVRDCTITTCPLHPFRLGKNPFRKRELTEEQRREIGERLNCNKKS
jgi:hypothetical protein